MFYHQCIFSRRLVGLLMLILGAAFVQPGFGAEPASPAADQTDLNATSALPSQNVTVNLINRLVERGVLTKRDSADLLLLAEADAAEARAQAALLQAALAQAAAAQARAKALMAQLALRQPAAEPAPNLIASAASTAPATIASVEELERTAAAAPTATTMVSAPARARAAAPSPSANDSAESIPEDTVRVTYVPEVVKAQLREEIKQEVLDQAREENWASPRTFPDWVTRFRLFGDIRFRYEGIHYPVGNDNTGAFPNFNTINSGAPFDVSGTIFSPQFNVDQNRNRLRLRARAGAAVDLGQSFTAGLRLATGENNSPVTQNQSLGAAGSGQGGNFSKYSVWLDRGFLKYEVGGQPDNDFAVSLGRFDNPFFATSMIWADDLGFDGAVAQGRFPVGEDVTPFFAIGAFPVFNTDLNFASNQPAKFKSNDKWLYAGQLGVTWELGKDISLKLGAAYYHFQNIEGKVSSPLNNIASSSDAGDTDSSRPAFAQKGNTYIALRDIVAGPLNSNGTTNQFQYFGLATPFHELAFTTQLEFNKFEPFQVALSGEYVKNLAFDRNAITLNGPPQLLGAVNNNASNGTTFGGGNTGWMVNLKIGDAALKERWNWNVSFSYRRVGSDAVVDGFNDSDFGGGGTNVKGFAFGGNLALSPGVWVGLRWLSASEVAGPTFKNDIIQLDFNGKF